MVRLAIQAPAPSLSANVERFPGVAVVNVEGELDLDGAPKLCAAIAAARRKHVIVDLSRVAFCDSTGLKALMDAAREVAIAGARLIAIVPEEGPVRRVVAMTGAEEFLGVTSNRDRVVSALRGVNGR